MSCSKSEIPNYESYKQLKSLVKQEDPCATKVEIYTKLLEPFKHAKRLDFDPATRKARPIYICKYNECNKEYTKIWNLLDHVRMHEGIKPYQCDVCQKSYTQKGNLKKHMKQHQMKSLKERKKHR